MNRRKQKKRVAAQRAEDEYIQQQLTPQIDAANVRFQELLPKIDALCAEHGFTQYLVSAGFEPTIDNKPVAFLSFAGHSTVTYTDNLATMMETVGMCVDKALHIPTVDKVDEQPISFRPNQGYA